MNDKVTDKPFGIVVELPENDPLSAPHLLGDKWEGARWFATEEERDKAFDNMLSQPGYYRQGDKPSIRLSKVESS